MAYTNFDGGALSQYVNDNKEIIMKDVVFGSVYGDTIPVMTKQLGVKGTEKIHPAKIEAVLQSASNCGFNPQGDLKIADKNITTEQVKVNTEFCPDKLINTFAEYKVRVGANEDALPFEAEIVDGLVKDINRQVEEGVWTKLEAEEGLTTFTYSEANATTAYEKIMATYMRMPEDTLEDGIIFVSPALFREYVNDLVNKNLYHYNPADGDLAEIFIPGSGVKVRKARGIKSGKTYATSPKNMVFATDFMSNKEEVKIWYSDDADVYRVKVRFNYGAAFIFNDMVVSGRD